MRQFSSKHHLKSLGLKLQSPDLVLMKVSLPWRRLNYVTDKIQFLLTMLLLYVSTEHSQRHGQILVINRLIHRCQSSAGLPSSTSCVSGVLSATLMKIMFQNLVSGGTDWNFCRTPVPDCIHLPVACLSVRQSTDIVCVFRSRLFLLSSIISD